MPLGVVDSLTNSLIGKVLINIFIGAYLVFAVFWDSPEINLIHKRVKSKLASWVHDCGLGYAWSMYVGPFVTITRLQTRIIYADNTTEIVTLPPRFEFRRFYFMLGVRGSPVIVEDFLQYVRKQLRDAPRQVDCIEIVKKVWKSPTRVGGFWGRFEISQDECRETVVALWKRT